MDKLGVKHKRTVPLRPRANGEVEQQNKSLLKAMRLARAEGKPWQQELLKYLVAYRSTLNSTTGVSLAELLYGRKIRTKMAEFERAEEEEMPGTIEQQARDQDAERKQRGAESTNKRAVESDVSEGDMVFLMGKKQNKLSTMYDPEPYSVVSKRDLVVIERGETLLKSIVGHVEWFIDPSPQIPQQQKEGTWPLEQTSVREPVIVTDPEPVTGSPAEGHDVKRVGRAPRSSVLLNII